MRYVILIAMILISIALYIGAVFCVAAFLSFNDRKPVRRKQVEGAEAITASSQS